MKPARVAVTAAISVALAACGATPTATTSISSPSPALPAMTPAESAAPSVTPAAVPRAEIVTADATIAGTLGTYTIDDGGSDAPWLPFGSIAPVGLGSTEMPVIRFVDGVVIGQFQAEIAAAADTSGASARAVPVGALAADGRSFGIGSLPVGRWVLEARVFRADGRGDGLTFWAVTVR